MGTAATAIWASASFDGVRHLPHLHEETMQLGLAGVLRRAGVGCIAEYGVAGFLRTAGQYSKHGYADVFVPPQDLGAHACGSACRPNRLYLLAPPARQGPSEAPHRYCNRVVRHGAGQGRGGKGLVIEVKAVNGYSMVPSGSRDYQSPELWEGVQRELDSLSHDELARLLITKYGTAATPSVSRYTTVGEVLLSMSAQYFARGSCHSEAVAAGVHVSGLAMQCAAAES